ncbi:hypothetical protein ACPA2N_25715 [Ectopseudomonas hydrolytica]
MRDFIQQLLLEVLIGLLTDLIIWLYNCSVADLACAALSAIGIAG